MSILIALVLFFLAIFVIMYLKSTDTVNPAGEQEVKGTPHGIILSNGKIVKIALNIKYIISNDEAKAIADLADFNVGEELEKTGINELQEIVKTVDVNTYSFKQLEEDLKNKLIETGKEYGTTIISVTMNFGG